MPAGKLHDPLPHFRRRGAPGAQLRAVAVACCREAVRDCAGEPEPATVHRARRLLKRARAVLRLADALDLCGAEEAGRRLSARARELGPLRDAVVTANVARKVEKHLGRRVRENLGIAEIAAPTKAAAWWRGWRRRLEAEARRIDRLTWDAPTRKEIQRALSTSAERGCRRAKKACAKPKIERVHAWRKALIALREQIAVTRPLLDERADRLHARLDELAKCLGRATDSEVFVQAARKRRAKSSVTALGRKRRERAIAKAVKCWPKVKRLLRKEL